MDSKTLKNVYSTIEPDKHIICGRRGSEENVKIKIILPLIEYLGFDLIKDTDFELFGTDIVLFDNKHNPIVIIETKAWEQSLTDHLNQCLEYTFKLAVPLILISSGQHFSLYSALGHLEGLKDTKPILNFSFNELMEADGEIILDKLKALIGKDEIFQGGIAINQIINKQLEPAKSIEMVRKEFTDKCLNYVPIVKTIKINELEFDGVASTHDESIRDLLLWCRDEFQRIARENKNVSLRYRSKEIGLEYLLNSHPRSKILGLVGIYPEKSKIAFGLENWKKLNCPQGYLEKIHSFSRQLKTKEQARDLVNMVEGAIKSVNKIVS